MRDPDSLSLPFDVEWTSKGIRYRLPVRDLSGLRQYGWFIIGFGLVGTLFMLFWMAGPFWGGIAAWNQAPLFAIGMWVFSAFGLIGLNIFVKILAAGIGLLRNRLRCEIEVRENKVISIEHLGWFRFRRKKDIEDIRQLEIVRGDADKDSPEDAASRFPQLRELFGIRARDAEGGEVFWLVPAYPEAVLVPLAHELAGQLEQRGVPSISRDWREKGTSGKEKVAGAISVSLVREEAPPRVLEQPPHSATEVVELDGTRAYRIPPRGLKGTHGLFAFSVIWLVITSIISSMFLFIGLEKGDGPVWVPPLILGLFLIIGIWMLVASLNMARRSVMIGVDPERLFIERNTLFGTKWIEIRREEVERIVKGHSGTEVNEVPIMELHIHDQSGTRHGLLSQLDNDELDWLAYELNRELGLGDREPPSSESP